MKTRTALVIVLLLSTTMKVNAQATEPRRSVLQQSFISKHFIEPQFPNLKVESAATIDSLFSKIQKEWEQAAPDTLKKYKLHMPLSAFKHIDAYVYIWTLISISQDMNIAGKFAEHLLPSYLIPSMLEDFATFKQHHTLNSLQLTYEGSIGNTLSLGSSNRIPKDISLRTYNVYKSCETLCKPLLTSTDTAIRSHAKALIQEIEVYKYDLETQVAIHNGNSDKALGYLLTGLASNRYSSFKINTLAERVLQTFIKSGEKDKSLKLLNALMLNTTEEHVKKQTLNDWYSQVDPVNGKAIYASIAASLPKGSFKVAKRKVEMPKVWNFISNAVSLDKIKKTNYYLIDVWYTGCYPCILEVPELNKFYERFKNREDVTFLSLNTDFVYGKRSEKHVLDSSTELHIKFPVVYDNNTTNLMAKLDVRSFPTKYIVDSSGNILAKLDNSEMSLKSFELFINELK